MQAAPVLANLRNLAIAEIRAATDVLTGLPNNRSVQDTLRRVDADSLVRAAARALYAAKGRGRNRVELFESRQDRAKEPDSEPAPPRP